VSFPSVSVDELERWLLFGAQWRLAGRSDDGILVDLCQCTGEPVERRESRDPEVIDYVLKRL
jgi:hypothetical protein